MQTENFFKSIQTYFSTNNIPFEVDKHFNNFSFKADIYAIQKGRSFGPFFPYEDHFFIHDFNDSSINNKNNLEALHEKARKYVNSFFKLPKALRYKVPNIITVAVSYGGFSLTTVDYVKKSTYSMIGGEKHSIFLIDLVGNIVISQGLEKTYVEGIPVNFKKVNPSNRAYYIIHTIAEIYFQKK